MKAGVELGAAKNSSRVRFLTQSQMNELLRVDVRVRQYTIRVYIPKKTTTNKPFPECGKLISNKICSMLTYSIIKNVVYMCVMQSCGNKREWL